MSIDRKAAAAAAKERKVRPGIFAARIGTAAWIGRSPNLDGLESRLGFELRQGCCRCRPLQQAWQDGQGAGFTIEVLEVMADAEDAPPYQRDAWLRDRAAFWRQRLNAATFA